MTCRHLINHPSQQRGRLADMASLGRRVVRPFYVSIAVRNPEFRDQFANGCTEGRPGLSLHGGTMGAENGQGVAKGLQGGARGNA
jgi:hypothetical protein